MIDSSGTIAHQAELDATGLKCPLPVLKTRKAIKELSVGDVLKVIATDTSTRVDMPAFCKTTGHQLRAVETSPELLTFWIEKV